MKLIERIRLLSLLPTQGKFEELIASKSISNKIAVTSEEVDLFEIKSNEDNSLSWNKVGAESFIEIDFTDNEKNLISNILKKYSEECLLTLDMVDLYEKFVK